MRPYRVVLVLVALLTVAPTCDGAGRKKLIEMGWDEPDPAYMRAHLAELEATPFDGCVYHLPYPGSPGETFGKFGKPQNYAWAVWGTRRFHDEDLSAPLADLRATPFRRFRSNFLRMNVTPGTLDWFDDHSVVMSNLRLGAGIARRAGSAGVLLDTEQYQGHLFEYAAQRDAGKRSYREYSDQARRRGQEAMRALEQGFPGLTVFLTFGVTHPYIVSDRGRFPIEKQPYGLLIPFLDGMILAASDSAKIVDGMEASFPVKDPAALDRYVQAQTSVLPLVSDSLKYRRVVSRSFGIWLDFDQQHKPWHVDDTSKNYRPPAALRSVVKRALELSDDYVWVYGEAGLWWPRAGKPKSVPTDYDRALRDAQASAH